MKIKLHRRRLWGMAGSAVITLAALGWYTYDLLRQNPPGYCAAQKRYIADDEFIRTAVALHEWEMNSDYEVDPNGKRIKKKDSHIHKNMYQEWERSRSRPDCCRVYRQATKSVVNRILGWQEVEVVLSFDPENLGEGYYLPFAFDVCGQLLLHDFTYHLPSSFSLTTSNYQEFITTNTK